MDIRFTPAFAVASFLTSIVVVWLAIGLATDHPSPTMLFNIISMAAVGIWLNWASGRRRDLAQKRAAQESGAEATLRAVKSRST